MTDQTQQAAPEVSNNPVIISSGAYHNMEKLDGVSNYTTWKFSTRMSLTLEGLWDCVVGENVNADESINERALAKICLGVKPSCYQYVHDCKTAKEAWEKLATIFEDKGLYRRVVLLRKLHHAEYTDHNGMSEYINNVMTLVQQLGDIGKVIEDDEVAELLLSGLPADFDVLVSGLETACISQRLSSELVRTRLLQEEFRMVSNKQSSSNNMAFFSKKRKPIICHFCKKPGHMKSKCFQWKRQQQQSQQKNPDMKERSLLASSFMAVSS